MSKQEPDLELKKAFIELQGKVQETNQKLRIADVQIDSLKKQITHAQLTDKEIQNLGASTRVYESVGRMFLLTDIPKVRENLTQKVNKCNDKISSLQSNKTYLEKSLQEKYLLFFFFININFYFEKLISALLSNLIFESSSILKEPRKTELNKRANESCYKKSIVIICTATGANPKGQRICISVNSAFKIFKRYIES
ncbi:Prefoldin subunit 1 [Armadillidium nasatum]|uniref:Prefoldin subunit 1 n=1 Tax=Armadillidium nasatum TaxID=96803 RepID=A0A5N5STX0_9CRUS|nr:Prefoldin subunit 1 [Armadillidium nasatum]